MKPTEDEIEDEGGWMFEVESESARANGFKFWVWRDASDILDAENLCQMQDGETIVIRRKWYTVDEIEAVSEDV